MSKKQEPMGSRRAFLAKASALGAAAAIPAWLQGCARAASRPTAASTTGAVEAQVGNASRLVVRTAPPPLVPASAFTLRRSAERGGADHGWLNTRHSFSFARYQDPAHMGFRALRVINEDRVRAGAGFPMHPHRDMEIITWVLEGALEHRDSLGNGSIIRPGDAQRMSAGTGIRHSEFEPSRKDGVYFLQIWLHPDRRGHTPGYEQKHIGAPDPAVPMQLVASPDGAGTSVQIHQDARLYVARLRTGAMAHHDLAPGRHAWLQVARGAVRVNGAGLAQGDGASTSSHGRIELTATAAAEVLVFDLA